MHPDALALFRELAERSPAERGSYYERHDVPQALRADLESLLAFDRAAPDSLENDVAVAAGELLAALTTPSAAASGTRGSGPTRIGRFQVIRLLGRGGMGEVYLARDPVLDREVAVKLISGELQDPGAHDRLVREARAAGRLRHPNIVTIFDAGEHDGRPYIAMEYVPGEALRSLIRRRAPLPLRQRLELIEGACAGLAHAHRAGVVHLDVKPDNLMLDETGIVKVLDFGVARVLWGETLATRHMGGTLAYMSPEQVAGKVVDHRSDVFSLGCVLFELVTYAQAYVGSPVEIVTKIAGGLVPSLRDTVPGIDPRLDAVVRRTMALDPSARYGDLDDLRTELARLRVDIDPNLRPQASRQPGSDATVAMPLTPSTSPARQRTSLRNSVAVLTRPQARVAVILVLAFAVTAAFAVLTWRETPESAEPESPGTARAPTLADRTLPIPEAHGGDAGASVPARDAVWRALAAGNRAGVLQMLRSSGSGGSGIDAALVSEVLEAVRTSVLQDRLDAARTSDPASSPVYRSAEQELARATRLRNSDPLQALEALWQASDLYARAVRERPRPPQREAERPSPAPVQQPPAVEGSGQQQAPPAPPPLVEARPAEALPPPAVEEPRAPDAPAVKPELPSPPRRSDGDAVLEALQRYQNAYQALNATRVAQAYPTLTRDQVEQLQLTFASVTTYEITLRDPRVDIQGDTAVVRALVARRVTPRVGAPQFQEIPTEFRLRRDGDAWVITAVVAR